MIFDMVSSSPEERLKNVLISDKQFCPDRVEKVLRSDIFTTLSNYCVLSPENLNVKIEVLKDGSYKFFVEAVSDRLKIFGSLPD